MHTSYLSFLLHRQNFLNPIFLHPKITKNTKKLQQIAPKSVKCAIFCVQSRNIYTGQNLFTQAPPVVPVTNMRYGYMITLGVYICPFAASYAATKFLSSSFIIIN